MNLEIMKEFFGWMTLVNLGFYIWTAVMSCFCKGLLSRISTKVFGVNEETGNMILYGYVGAYKLLFIVFNLVPWIALTIMT